MVIAMNVEPRRPAEQNLSRYRYHTGGLPTPLDPDEPCPVLFRDVGFEAMARFLNGELEWLCGPLSPVTYLRTTDYCEPYTDYIGIGRIMLLQPRSISPWRSGVESVFIASRKIQVDVDGMVFIPQEVSFSGDSAQFLYAKSIRDVEDIFGVRCYRDAKQETRLKLEQAIAEHAESETLAGPLRKLFQSADECERERARAQMQRLSLTESDLCTAWHHLPQQRREQIRWALAEFQGEMS